MKRLVGAVCAACSLGPFTLLAQVPAGPEFHVNSYTTRSQYRAAVAADHAGNFVVVWTSERQDAGYAGIFGQRYDAAGAARGDEFQVNTYSTGQQLVPGVAVDGSGGFVVVWMSYGQDGSRGGIFGRRYDAEGLGRGGEFQVNTYTTGYQYAPTVAAGASGAFVVAWIGYGQDGSADGVFARRYDAAGGALGGAFQVNTYTTGNQGEPTQGPAGVAMDGAGRFVITWPSFNQDGQSFGVFARRFDGAGTPLGVELQVNTFTTSTQHRPVAAADADGRFVIAWSSGIQDASGFGVFARRYDADGGALGAEFQVNTYTLGQQDSPAVATDASGGFVVTWASAHDSGSYGVFAQRYLRDGAPRGGEFLVNTYTTGLQFGGSGAVSGDPFGNFVVAWSSYPQDGSFFGVFGQRYGGLLPAALSVDVSGNRVLDPGETAAVAPAWRNVNGGAQAFTGAASAFTGPQAPNDPLYTIVDGVAAYGTVADGAQGSCAATGDCYLLAVATPMARPAAHWDARFTEDLLPAAQGQSHTWTLHVGASFGDVPGGSGFYRFVETLLHHGVTGGCTASLYCPASGTTRAQMAVFALVGREGPAYAPPACGAPAVFSDVPASSPFCRWIEELARRGVVGGCGGGQYCPDADVSREQMAVFVLRTLDSTLDPPACGTPVFADVPASSPFCRWIEELARRGVVSGCGGGNYCPAAPVSREQMAVFISAGFGLALYGI